MTSWCGPSASRCGSWTPRTRPSSPSRPSGFWREAKGITLGYAIVASARGRGYATEAAGAVLGWAESRQIPVYASVRPPNPASERVLRKIGMELDDHYWDEDGERLVYRRSPNPRSAGRT
ncbi:GNAT family N-acetyltransferase [Actinopolymorpha pittospori]|uniref:RimJ/RimL family protein N-acetyltransferase n=1 Tax=Actinopolymorpha pittospori TaxID=648752 RepID=A0A927N345_9ACTN|nr:RimJ/RimL family protein N-acetyltransferase [Actinopolymorpha pittospori]